MAKKNKTLSTTPLANLGAYSSRTIILDKKGVPWVIDPHEGTISLAQIIMPSDEPMKQSAVKPKKEKR